MAICTSGEPESPSCVLYVSMMLLFVSLFMTSAFLLINLCRSPCQQLSPRTGPVNYELYYIISGQNKSNLNSDGVCIPVKDRRKSNSFAVQPGNVQFPAILTPLFKNCKNLIKVRHYFCPMPLIDVRQVVFCLSIPPHFTSKCHVFHPVTAAAQGN